MSTFPRIIICMAFALSLIVPSYSKSLAQEDVVHIEGPMTLEVVLRTLYVDGEVSEEIVQETIWALDDFWAKYADWQLIDMDDSSLLFEKEVDDISPLLKVNGFFGISDDGVLSIYNGKPEMENVIQSFFQIDVQKLEGKKQQQLKQGIRVKSKEEYTDVLEAMKQFVINEDKGS
ncbi:intercompartmental signaling factor BofC [Bacillus sp. FJAT-50079]|uniref:intercompartmental signaling factor BofC n=1 Tax=Bacillus sp. FJAT-50079 TaxID=2833577 RepID=UPI001BC9B5FA|nr:intercompartmental signaling factor BofC [Bacillus sp. FJAT-50079]MBS4208977.1 intercompartmental signaling factor BofC [Bacillus sp. FJAT-50079]